MTSLESISDIIVLGKNKRLDSFHQAMTSVRHDVKRIKFVLDTVTGPYAYKPRKLQLNITHMYSVMERVLSEKLAKDDSLN